MSTIRLKYNGPLKNGRKVVPLPVPYTGEEHTGDVVCDPVGTFPREDGLRLLDLCGDAFEVVGEPDPRVKEQIDLDTPGDELAQELPTDRPVEAHRTIKVARMRAAKLGLEIRENRDESADPEKPFELWAPSPASPEGAATAHPTDEVKGTQVANG